MCSLSLYFVLVDDNIAHNNSDFQEVTHFNHLSNRTIFIKNIQ